MADIAPLLRVEDLSLYYFLGIDLLFIFVVLGFLYFFLSRFSLKDRRVRSAKKELLNLKFENPKKDAYRATRLIKELANSQNRASSKRLISHLEAHKYKKSVPKLSENLKRDIKEFVKEVDI